MLPLTSEQKQEYQAWLGKHSDSQLTEGGRQALRDEIEEDMRVDETKTQKQKQWSREYNAKSIGTPRRTLDVQ
jgi:hypothetical protein